MKRIYDKDVASGLMFAAIGGFGLVLSQQFDFGSTARPGPGFFPSVLSVLLAAIGLLVAAKGLRVPAGNLSAFAWRPLAFITLGVISFALSVGPLGLIAAVFFAALVASLAKPGFGTVARLAVASALALFSAFLFVLCLGLPIPLWPS